MIIHMEGPDRCGKTTIAKKLAKIYNLEYWRYSSVDETLRNDPNAFANILKYYYSQIPQFAEMLINQNSGLILDRNYITEWVYSQLFGRASYPGIVKQLEKKYSEMNGVIIYCWKEDYGEFEDEFVNKEQINEIKTLYGIYLLNHAKMPILSLNTTNENLEEQLKTINDFLWKHRKKEKLNVDENKETNGGRDYTNTSSF